ncbi:MAG: CBS domain-containing protein [Candidatus Zixiibacteriota bacterium]|nr:MAG: CBS domain-containing protein [candidate division Zixibacteria bacterium]
MLVKALLENKSKEVITAAPKTSIDEAMGILIEKKIGCLPVVDDNKKLIGIISDKDIFEKVYQTKGKYEKLTVEDLMKTELIVGLPDDDINYIAGIMEKNWIRHVPIVDGDNVIGMVSLRDIHRNYVKAKELENRYLMDMLEKRDKSGDI